MLLWTADTGGPGISSDGYTDRHGNYSAEFTVPYSLSIGRNSIFANYIFGGNDPFPVGTFTVTNSVAAGSVIVQSGGIITGYVDNSDPGQATIRVKNNTGATLQLCRSTGGLDFNQANLCSINGVHLTPTNFYGQTEYLFGGDEATWNATFLAGSSFTVTAAVTGQALGMAIATKALGISPGDVDDWTTFTNAATNMKHLSKAGDALSQLPPNIFTATSELFQSVTDSDEQSSWQTLAAAGGKEFVAPLLDAASIIQSVAADFTVGIGTIFDDNARKGSVTFRCCQ